VLTNLTRGLSTELFGESSDFVSESRFVLVSSIRIGHGRSALTCLDSLTLAVGLPLLCD